MGMVCLHSHGRGYLWRCVIGCWEGLGVGLWVKEVLVERLVARWGVKLELRGLLWLESWLLWLLVLVSWAGWGNLLGLVITPLGYLLPRLVHPVEGWWGSLERLMIGWILALESWAGGAFPDLANCSHIGLFTSWYFVKDTISKIFHEHLFV